MIKDMEGHQIDLAQRMNGHRLVLGCSGSGKTYFLCREMEQAYERGQNIMVLDYSGSYTSEELRKNAYKFLDQTEFANPFTEEGVWRMRVDNFVDEITEAFLYALDITSYYQRKLLREAVRAVLKKNGEITIPRLFGELKLLLEIKEDEISRKNILRLLTRLEPFLGISRLVFHPGYVSGRGKISLMVFQVSDFPEKQGRFLSEFLLEIIWREAHCRNRRADILVLDEFQKLRIKSGSAVSSMLREGRKFGMSVWLSSQYLGNYDRQAVETLMQAENMLFFKPAEKEIREIAGWISQQNRKTWMGILHELEVGQAVLKGNYQIVPNKSVCSSPLICKIK